MSQDQKGKGGTATSLPKPTDGAHTYLKRARDADVLLCHPLNAHICADHQQAEIGHQTCPDNARVTTGATTPRVKPGFNNPMDGGGLLTDVRERLHCISLLFRWPLGAQALTTVDVLEQIERMKERAIEPYVRRSSFRERCVLRPGFVAQR